MQSRVHLPTDNIFKFYALFGLLLLITSLVLFTQLYKSHNDRVFERYVELKTLESLKELTATHKAKKEVLDAQNKIDRSDRKFHLNVIGVFISISLVLMFFGFYNWHTKIQPNQDRITDLNIQKAELEVKALTKQLQRTVFLSRLPPNREKYEPRRN